MPEVLVLFLVLLAAAICYVSARVHARNPEIWNPYQEVRRLRTQQSRLEERLEIAAVEKWDDGMRGHLTTELRTTRFQLAHMVAEMDDDA